jgi:glycosyltransferase involved in cell wall biosynthesis
MTTGRYVCAFRGARDRYQAAIALAEADLLETLITDAYLTPEAASIVRWLPAAWRAKLSDRTAEDLPDSRVQCLWSTTIVEHARHRAGFSPRATWMKLDAEFGEAAASAARKTRANLLMYSPYAWEAFTARYSHTPKRVLFQYHPHPDLEARILADDARLYPEYGESFTSGLGGSVPEILLGRERQSWRHADVMICSSSFTRRSLIEAGVDADKCRVVPYGVTLPASIDRRETDHAFRVLFVGSGGQRKGLHHLLLAWQRAALPDDSQLVLVCRVLDEGIRKLARAVPRVHIREGATAQELDRLYATSTLLAMPSLVEGFGHVYLEALARGCPVLGTPNTCLPDLGGEADGVFTTAVGDVAALAARLERLASCLPDDQSIRMHARNTAGRYPWSRFRSEMRAALQ